MPGSDLHIGKVTLTGCGGWRGRKGSQGGLLEAQALGRVRSDKGPRREQHGGQREGNGGSAVEGVSHRRGEKPNQDGGPEVYRGAQRSGPERVGGHPSGNARRGGTLRWAAGAAGD